MFDIMERIIVQLPRQLLKDLDRAAKEEKLSRAALTRRIIELAIAERRRNEEFAAIIKSFADHPDEDDLGEFLAVQTQTWFEYEEG